VVAAFLDHAVKASPEAESLAVSGLVGQILISRKVASGGTLDPSDQSMMALCTIFFVDASARSLLVVIDFCSLVRATPGETLDPGLPGRAMAARGIALPPVGVVLDVDSG
jgi:hypothetical protein